MHRFHLLSVALVPVLTGCFSSTYAPLRSPGVREYYRNGVPLCAALNGTDQNSLSTAVASDPQAEDHARRAERDGLIGNLAKWAGYIVLMGTAPSAAIGVQSTEARATVAGSGLAAFLLLDLVGDEYLGASRVHATDAMSRSNESSRTIASG